MASLEEIDSTVQELMTVLASQDDLHDLKYIANKRKDQRNVEEEKNNEIKQIITKLLSINEEEEKTVAALSQRVEKLKEKLQTDHLEKDTLMQQVGTEKKNRASLKEANEELRKEAEEIQQKSEGYTRNIPNKYITSLFSSISRIRWDHSGDENEVKGYVASLNDVKPFSLNSQTNSTFFITNYLWDMIDS